MMYCLGTRCIGCEEYFPVQPDDGDSMRPRAFVEHLARCEYTPCQVVVSYGTGLPDAVTCGHRSGGDVYCSLACELEARGEGKRARCLECGVPLRAGLVYCAGLSACWRAGANVATMPEVLASFWFNHEVPPYWFQKLCEESWRKTAKRARDAGVLARDAGVLDDE